MGFGILHKRNPMAIAFKRGSISYNKQREASTCKSYIHPSNVSQEPNVLIARVGSHTREDDHIALPALKSIHSVHTDLKFGVELLQLAAYFA